MYSLLLFAAFVVPQDEFSGPQKDEALPDCKIKVVFGPAEGQQIQLHQSISDKPSLVLFVHEMTRPSVGLTRSIANYAKQRNKDGLVTNVIFLTSDPTDTENWMNRAKRALPAGVNISISPDGIEGPGAFGLNRKMQVTALVANKQKKVVANFGIIQPSMAADAQKIGNSIAKLLGDKKMPTPQELGVVRRGASNRGAGKYEQLMRPFIQKSNTDEMVEMKAKEIEAAAKKDPELRKRIHQVANRIIDAGKLSNYGTEKAQRFLKKWAKEFGQSKEDAQQEKRSSR